MQFSFLYAQNINVRGHSHTCLGACTPDCMYRLSLSLLVNIICQEKKKGKQKMSCHENVIIHMVLVVDKLTSPYDKHRALDVPNGMRVQCNLTGVKSINELRPRKFCCFAKYFAEGEDFLLGHCFPAGQRWNGTWVVPLKPMSNLYVCWKNSSSTIKPSLRGGH